MNAPPPVDPQLSTRIADTLEFGAKVAIALAAIWAFLAKVAKPYLTWRRVHRQALVREAIKEDLATLTTAIADAGGCTERVERSLAEHKGMFEDIDALLDIVLENSERIGDVKDRLVERSLMRSGDAPQSAATAERLAQLIAQRRARRRKAEAEAARTTPMTQAP